MKKEYNILPNYLKLKIVSYLVDNDNKSELLYVHYQRTGEYRKNVSEIKNFPNFNQINVLSYSLVCKDWFNWCRKSITTLLSSTYNESRINKKGIQSEYSIIDFNNIQIYIYEYLDEDDTDTKYDSEEVIIKRFPNVKEILYNYAMDYDEFLLERDREFFQNYKFTNISKIRLAIFIIDGELIASDFPSTSPFKANIDTLKISIPPVSNQHLFTQIISNYFINVRQFFLIDDMQDWNDQHYHLYDIFKTKPFSLNIEKIIVKNQFIDPSILCEPILPNLKSLNVSFHFHELLFHMQRLHHSSNGSEKEFIAHFKNLMMYDFQNNNDQNDYYDGEGICENPYIDDTSNSCIKRTKHVIQDWLEFCNSMKSLQSLQVLKISEICLPKKNNSFIIHNNSDQDTYKVGGRNDKLPSYFSLPIISLIENTNSIKTLSLKRMVGYIDITILNSITNNNTIVDLNLSNSIWDISLLKHLLYIVLPRAPNIITLTIYKMPITFEEAILDFIENENSHPVTGLIILKYELCSKNNKKEVVFNK